MFEIFEGEKGITFAQTLFAALLGALATGAVAVASKTVSYVLNRKRAKALRLQLYKDLSELLSGPENWDMIELKNRELLARSSSAFGNRVVTFVSEHSDPTDVLKFEKTLRLINHFESAVLTWEASIYEAKLVERSKIIEASISVVRQIRTRARKSTPWIEIIS
ncbi:MAG: hypothetical protein U1E10_19560 [Bdellovibrionales bacterium]|nr:hypothetical protein [Bdellovibrionales bacterium]